MLRRLLVFSILFVLGILGAAWADSSVGIPDVHVGDIWKYRSLDGYTNETKVEYSHRIVKLTDQEITIQIKNKNVKGEKLQFLTREWNPLDTDGTKFEPFYPEYKFPMSVGASWTQEYKTFNISGSTGFVRAKIVALEKVTVPAGTFDAYRIERDIEVQSTTADANTTKGRIITWYAPSVKKYVRREAMTFSNGRERSKEVNELLEYSLQGKSAAPSNKQAIQVSSESHPGAAKATPKLAEINETDTGTYVILDKDKKPVDMFYRLSKINGKWVMDGKKPGESWKNISCDSGCEYRTTTQSERERYFPADWRKNAHIACIQNVAQAFCRYNSKDDPTKAGYVVMALVTGRPIPMFIKRVAASASAEGETVAKLSRNANYEMLLTWIKENNKWDADAKFVNNFKNRLDSAIGKNKAIFEIGWGLTKSGNAYRIEWTKDNLAIIPYTPDRAAQLGYKEMSQRSTVE
jgi:hypothetical protein